MMAQRWAKLGMTLFVIVAATTGCKQDQVFAQASDMKQTSDQIASYAATMGSDPVKSCERIATYNNAAKAVTFSSLQGVPPVVSDCPETEGQAVQLQKHLEIFALYADQLERAATNKPIDYKLGNLTSTLADAKIIGVAGRTDADAITLLGNAIANFLTSNARYNVIRSTVLAQNANVQEMAHFAEAVAVSDWCEAGPAVAHNVQPGYCSIFEPEMDTLSSSYCHIGIRIFGSGSCLPPPPVFPGQLNSGAPATSDTAEAGKVCDADILRSSLRDGVHLPAESPPPYRAPKITPSHKAAGGKTVSATEWQARHDLANGYTTGVSTVYNEVRTGWSYGSAVCEFARAHQRLFDTLQ